MSQTVSITNKPEGNGLASDSQSPKPKISDNVLWRRDGEDNQLIVLSKEDMPLPLILNLTAARIFLLCNGENSLEDIARGLGEEFGREDYAGILDGVKKQVGYFLDRGIVEV